jgi:hypothetical protein
MKALRLHPASLAVYVALLALAGGCSTSRQVNVDAMAAPGLVEQTGQSYVIHVKPATGEAPSELRDQEAVAHVKTALSARGMWEAPDAGEAELVVEVEYGIDPARVRYDILRVALYGRVQPDPSIRQVSNPRAPEVTNQSAGIPTGRPGDFQEVAVPVTVREKHLTVSGRENRPATEGRPPPEVFRVSASIEDQSTDLRGALPVLASAIMDQIGRQTDGTTVATIREDDEAVDFIRRGL